MFRNINEFRPRLEEVKDIKQEVDVEWRRRNQENVLDTSF